MLIPLRDTACKLRMRGEWLLINIEGPVNVFLRRNVTFIFSPCIFMQFSHTLCHIYKKSFLYSIEENINGNQMFSLISKPYGNLRATW